MGGTTTRRTLPSTPPSTPWVRGRQKISVGMSECGICVLSVPRSGGHNDKAHPPIQAVCGLGVGSR